MVELVSASGLIDVEVVYANPEKQTIVRLTLPEGTTAEQAVQHSGLLTLNSEIDQTSLKIGVFGVVVSAGTVLKNGDRVEIYRSLFRDPKETRRQRAKTIIAHQSSMRVKSK